MTTFTDMLYQNGGAPVNGMFTNGKAFFVDPYRGGDSMRGDRVNRPRKTVKSAQGSAVAGRNDVIYFLSYTNTLATTEDALTSTLTWDKDSTHLIGVNSANHAFQRSTIRADSTATAASVAPLMLISANNCRFENISVLNDRDATAALGAVKITGSRNHFKNCHLAGNVGATGTSDYAGQYSLWLNGAQENLFEDCVIGTDTITRTAQTYETYFSAASGTGVARNVFKRCLFITYAGANTMTHITAPANAMDRWNLFQDCTFINAIGSAATTMSQAFAITGSGSPAGVIILRNCLQIGSSYTETTASTYVHRDSITAATATTHV